jgi:hypothetical protein
VNPAAPLFREEQPLGQLRLRLLLAVPPLFFLFLIVWQVWLGHPWGKRPMSNGGVIFLFVLLSLLYARLVTVKLTTEVFAGEIRVTLRGAFWRRRIPGASIRSAKVVSYDALRDYGGYGIRSGRLGRAYIAGGTQGVLLMLSGPEQVLIGSGRPLKLFGAIERMEDGGGADR